MHVPSGMQYFHLEHPEDKINRCDRHGCNGIADYLEVEPDGTEHHLCAFHTCSQTYASRLPSRAPDPNAPSRSFQII
jgi:hypothetical protein